MQRSRTASVPQKDNTRKPKYIHALLEKAAIRNREQEIVYDRLLQKERETEGNTYAGKEKFITPSYVKHLQENKLWQEEEERKAALEEDVTKKGDLTSFYLNLTTRNEAYGVGDATKKPKEEKIKEENKEGGRDNRDKERGREREGEKERDNSKERDRGDRDKDRSRSREDRDRSKDRDRGGEKERDNSKERDKEDSGKDRSRSRSVEDNRSRSRSVDDKKSSGSSGDSKSESSAGGSDSANAVSKKRPREEGEDNNNNNNNNNNSNNKANDKAKEVAGRRNDDAAINAARERYLKRKAEQKK